MGVTTPSPTQVAPPILSKPSISNNNYCASSTHLQQSFSYNNYYNNNPSKPTNNYQYSMSQDYHHNHNHQQANIFTFSNGFGRSQQEHLAQQIRRGKLADGYDPPPPLGGHPEDPPGGGLPVYETAGMLSEMFNFPPPPPPGTTSAGDLLMTRQQLAVSDWYTNRQQQQGVMGPVTNDQSSKNDHIHGMNADSAAAMQLFLMNPHQHQPRSPSPAPSSSNNASSSTLHMLLPNPSQFTWAHDNEAKAAAGMESRGLSLSLNSHLEAAKAEEFLYGAPGGGSSSSGPHHQFYQALNLQEGLMGQGQTHVGFGVAGSGGGLVNNSSSSSIGVVNVLRSSKYVKAAQELLEEFCSVGRGQLKKNKLVGKSNGNPSSSTNNNNDNHLPGNGPSSSAKDIPPLSAADRIEHQRRKVKLLSMLDEVDRRYNRYCEQMQMVVNSFDLVMGFGSAVPYTALAQKAMSRHFRCLKDAIAAQLKHSCDLLGEKDVSGSSGITKGETPRLKVLEQSLRQQRAFHQMGMMEQEAWRPQRGLPERSVNLLRAWLFEHFLNPYPSDADKHLLARQTGLSRNQVSNWFINARVRLWKPMVEDMYQQESKDEGSASEDKQTNSITNNNSGTSQTPPPTTTTATSSPPPPPPSTAAQLNANIEDDHSLFRFGDNHAVSSIMDHVAPPYNTCQRGDITTADYHRNPNVGSLSHATTADGIIRFGTNVGAGGDVSLTLGLRHAGNTPEKGSGASAFAVRDFGGC